MKKLILVFSACVAWASAASADPYVIAVIPKGSTHEYWKAMHAGARKAVRELNAAGIPVSIIWKGPLREDDRDMQIQVMENFIGRRVSGVVLAPLDYRALVGPVEAAVAAHIPVVIVDSDLSSKAKSSFIATNNREGGRIGGRHLGHLLGGKGNVILLRVMVGAASTEEREAGFLEVMQKEFPSITLISTDQYGGSTRDTAKTLSESLLNRFGGVVNGIFASNESTATGMLLALRDAGLAHGKVKFVGFDSGDTLVAGLAAGDIQGLVAQNPYKMGLVGVKTIVSVLRGESVPAVIDTGVSLVTPETMNQPDKTALLHPPVDE